MSKTASKSRPSRVDQRYINRMLIKYEDAFKNLDIESPVIEKGSDGNCLFYSLLHAETPEFHKKVKLPNSFDYNYSKSGVEPESVYHKNGTRLREYIGSRLNSAYKYQMDQLKTEKAKASGRVHARRLSKIVDLFGTEAMQPFAFNGDGDVDDTPYKDFLDPTFYAGDITLTAYSIMAKKHVIIFNMSSPTTEASVVLKRFEQEIPFQNDEKTGPNYIFLVRLGGEKTHFRTLRKLIDPMYITLHPEVLSRINAANKEQHSYQEFQDMLNIPDSSSSNNDFQIIEMPPSPPPKNIAKALNKTRKNTHSSSVVNKTRKNKNNSMKNDIMQEHHKFSNKIITILTSTKLNTKNENSIMHLALLESFLENQKKDMEKFIDSLV